MCHLRHNFHKGHRKRTRTMVENFLGLQQRENTTSPRLGYPPATTAHSFHNDRLTFCDDGRNDGSFPVLLQCEQVGEFPAFDCYEI